MLSARSGCGHEPRAHKDIGEYFAGLKLKVMSKHRRRIVMETYSDKLAELSRLRNEVRRLEASADAEAKSMSPLTVDQEHEMTATQARMDEYYQAAGRRAPPPLPYEKPRQFHNRLLAGLQVYHDQWRGKDLSGITEPNALHAIEKQIADAARANGATFGLADGQMKPIDKPSAGGHHVTEWVGKNASFIKHFARPVPRAILKTPQEYGNITRTNLLSRLTQVIPGWARETVRSPRSGF
jgi:hypothetical protein